MSERVLCWSTSSIRSRDPFKRGYVNRELGSRNRSACVAWTSALIGWVAVGQANAQSASTLPRISTGFVVAKNVVVTTAHSVEGCRTVQLGQPGQALAM